ncbi:menaquinol-cytochrome c reductase iron-sulfur subunit [soil metagenome]|nr:Rieske 2Fe-2S domain-containing protein [Gemmatimonadota bacterium]
MSSSRRRFLNRLGVGLGGLTALLAGLPVVGFLFSPVRREDEHTWRPVGALGEFPVGETRMVRYLDPEPLPWAGFAARSGAWVRREGEDEFVGFSMYCTHTACPITWSEGANLFMCPCHGGTFHRDGRVAGGPPPRPLDRFDIRVQDGQVWLRTMGAPRTG